MTEVFPFDPPYHVHTTISVRVVDATVAYAPSYPPQVAPRNHPYDEYPVVVIPVRGGGEFPDDVPITTGVIQLLNALGRVTAMIVCGVVDVVGA